MVLTCLSVVQFFVHAKICDIDIELTDHLFVLNRLLLQLFADLFEHLNLISVLCYTFLVPLMVKHIFSLF